MILHVPITMLAGCNRYFGRYTIREDHRLTLTSEIGSTKMACPRAVARQEQRYLALLSLVSAWQYLYSSGSLNKSSTTR